MLRRFTKKIESASGLLAGRKTGRSRWAVGRHVKSSRAGQDRRMYGFKAFLIKYAEIGVKGKNRGIFEGCACAAD